MTPSSLQQAACRTSGKTHRLRLQPPRKRGSAIGQPRLFRPHRLAQRPRLRLSRACRNLRRTSRRPRPAPRCCRELHVPFLVAVGYLEPVDLVSAGKQPAFRGVVTFGLDCSVLGRVGLGPILFPEHDGAAGQHDEQRQDEPIACRRCCLVHMRILSMSFTVNTSYKPTVHRPALSSLSRASRSGRLRGSFSQAGRTRTRPGTPAASQKANPRSAIASIAHSRGSSSPHIAEACETLSKTTTASKIVETAAATMESRKQALAATATQLIRPPPLGLRRPLLRQTSRSTLPLRSNCPPHSSHT